MFSRYRNALTIALNKCFAGFEEQHANHWPTCRIVVRFCWLALDHKVNGLILTPSTQVMTIALPSFLPIMLLQRVDSVAVRCWHHKICISWTILTAWGKGQCKYINQVIAIGSESLIDSAILSQLYGMSIIWKSYGLTSCNISNGPFKSPSWNRIVSVQ